MSTDELDSPLKGQRISLSSEPLDELYAITFLRTVQSGAEVLFSGVVRNQSSDRAVQHLDFEVYESMVLSQFDTLCWELRERWNVHRIVLGHRTGIVYPGETAVIAGISAAHRPEAFEACAWLMDELKRSIPIWKKEVFADGEEWVSPTP